jgi:hypothetical protein
LHLRAVAAKSELNFRNKALDRPYESVYGFAMNSPRPSCKLPPPRVTGAVPAPPRGRQVPPAFKCGTGVPPVLIKQIIHTASPLHNTICSRITWCRRPACLLPVLPSGAAGMFYDPGPTCVTDFDYSKISIKDLGQIACRKDMLNAKNG